MKDKIYPPPPLRLVIHFNSPVDVQLVYGAGFIAALQQRGSGACVSLSVLSHFILVLCSGTRCLSVLCVSHLCKASHSEVLSTLTVSHSPRRCLVPPSRRHLGCYKQAPSPPSPPPALQAPVPTALLSLIPARSGHCM